MAYTTIDDPSAHYQTAIYTGSSSSVTVTNDGNSNLQPDFIWVKRRNGANDHDIFDTNRGVTKRMWTNQVSSENTGDGTGVTIHSDGFNTGTYWGDVNSNGNTFVAFQWKANGGTTSSNTAGTITSTVQTNSTADFSIITYTGNGTDGANIGHGLSGAWDCVWIKNRGVGDDWQIYHKYQQDNSQNTGGSFNDTDAFATCANTSGRPTRTGADRINLNDCGDLTSINGSSENYLCYAFKEVKGYSKFGSYLGNGNADGPFVFTGFKPAWIMMKGVTGTRNWLIKDGTIDPYNTGTQVIYVNLNNAENAAQNMDLLSNGFKHRSTEGDGNADGVQYIYMAFAESPFVSSEGIPTTAR